MADLVRLFTCASVIALGGFSATSSMLACSSDPATTPAGDDDDDNNKKDAGKSSTSSSSSSSGNNGSTSSSGGDGGGGGTCNPTGTFTIGKPVYSVTAPGKVCDGYVKGGNDMAGPLGEFTITKLKDGNFSALKTGAAPENAITLAQADNICQIAGGIQAFGQKADLNGKEIDVKLTPSQYYDFDGTKIVAKTTFNIDSDPPGVAGAACTMQTVASGTKK